MVKPRADALRYAHIYGWDVSPQNVRQMNSSEEILLHEHLCGVWLWHKYSPMMYLPDPAQMPVIDYLFVHGYLTGILRGDIPSIDAGIP